MTQQFMFFARTALL